MSTREMLPFGAEISCTVWYYYDASTYQKEGNYWKADMSFARGPFQLNITEWGTTPQGAFDEAWTRMKWNLDLYKVKPPEPKPAKPSRTNIAPRDRTEEYDMRPESPRVEQTSLGVFKPAPLKPIPDDEIPF